MKGFERVEAVNLPPKQTEANPNHRIIGFADGLGFHEIFCSCGWHGPDSEFKRHFVSSES